MTNDALNVGLAGLDRLTTDVLLHGLGETGVQATALKDWPALVPAAVQVVLLLSAPDSSTGTQPAHRVPVVLLVNDPHPANSQLARAWGAVGWVAANSHLVQVSAALQSVVRRAARPGMTTNDTRSLVDALTRRELDVLAQVALGLENPDIASRLKISPHTVRTHVQNIFTKLDVSNRFAAVAAARAHGVLAHVGYEANGRP